MDELDLRIVAVLQADGTLTKAELAEAVGSTPSTCLRRVAELRRTGVLKACVYLADPAKLGRGIRAVDPIIAALAVIICVQRREA
ncbi:AsnC family transcriptional regulator [Mesorhizobium sp. M0159]|uniref:Lrp/AsnC family transcriptional regulator n=1 Tax=Mesorhizobium sp. M0159 TaxID=2956900 RepID=UPI00333CF77E